MGIVDEAFNILRDSVQPITIGLLAIFVVWLLFFPEKADILSSLILRAFSYVSKRAEQATVAREIQGHVNSFKRYVEKEAPDIMPYGLRIQWANPKEPEAYLKDGEVVVAMRQHLNRDRNIMTALLAFVPQALIPRTRQYVEGTLLESVDFSFIKKLLVREGYHSALNLLQETVVETSTDKSEDLKKCCSQVDDLDAQGYLTRILLKEFLFLGNRLYPRMPPAGILNETREFLDFLHRIATKEPNVDVPLTFDGTYIRVVLVLVAKPGKLNAVGLQPYVKRITGLLAEEYDAIYITGWGLNTWAVKNLGLLFKLHAQVSSFDRRDYKFFRGNTVMPAICVRLTSRVSDS